MTRPRDMCACGHDVDIHGPAVDHSICGVVDCPCLAFDGGDPPAPDDRTLGEYIAEEMPKAIAKFHQEALDREFPAPGVWKPLGILGVLDRVHCTVSGTETCAADGSDDTCWCADGEAT